MAVNPLQRAATHARRRDLIRALAKVDSAIETTAPVSGFAAETLRQARSHLATHLRQLEQDATLAPLAVVKRHSTCDAKGHFYGLKADGSLVCYDCGEVRGQ